MPELLKNLYSEDYISNLSQKIKEQYPDFEENDFKASVFSDQWDELELKGRMHHISDALYKHIHLSYEETIELLIAIGPDSGRLEGLFLPDFVEKFGLEEKWEVNMYALEKITPSASAEFAVRPFILKDTGQMMEQMLTWSKSGDLDVRRLSSEGCRPRLPWGMALKDFQKDPALIWPILENLKDDEEEYVRRSVANNLNDISKDHPDLVLDLAERWLKENGERKRMVKHALRTLLKKGNTRALMLFGFGDPTHILINQLEINPRKIKIGGEGEFQFELENQGEECLLRLEFAVDYLKKNGSHSRKVFQLSEKSYSNGSFELQKRHSFKQLSTRVHYPGTHRLAILVNGKEKAGLEFELE
ncbi:MAG: DNA alkylation repair protein [Bacteroidia bacterium]|nr:DNA alkylation repair protein [Bacteroidia bacterium]